MPSGNLSSTPTSDTCSLCWFPGHQAAYCLQRTNSNFVPFAPDSVTRAFAALSVGGEANDTMVPGFGSYILHDSLGW